MKIAVMLPCLNEEVAIGQVVRDFQSALSGADIYVYDNGSSDRTAELAEQAGAIVRTVVRRGKGHVVRQMFSDIEADVYVLADGDGTYDAKSAPALVTSCVDDNVAMVVGCRRSKSGHDTYRTGHVFGNWLFNLLARLFFGRRCNDLLSGFRVFSRQFVKSFPALSNGFEIETELTVHALSLNLATQEVDTPYRERARGSSSKLNTYRDGVKILSVMIRLFMDLRPLLFFSGIATLAAIAAIVFFIPILIEYLETGLVARFPTAILCMGLILTALLTFFSGLLLDSGARQSLEMKRLAFLAQGSGRRPQKTD